MNIETWRPVVGLEHSHEVSSFGNLRTIAREVPYYHSTYGTTVIRRLKAKTVPTRPDKNGYMIANLSTESAKTLTVKAHRVVAQAFLDNPDNKSQVNHKNGDKTDNTIDNLEWVTDQENRVHALKTGLHAVGSRSPHAKMTEAQVLAIKERIAAGDKNVDIAKDFGVSHKYVSGIRCGASWSWMSS